MHSAEVRSALRKTIEARTSAGTFSAGNSEKPQRAKYDGADVDRRYASRAPVPRARSSNVSISRLAMPRSR